MNRIEQLEKSIENIGKALRKTKDAAKGKTCKCCGCNPEVLTEGQEEHVNLLIQLAQLKQQLKEEVSFNEMLSETLLRLS